MAVAHACVDVVLAIECFVELVRDSVSLYLRCDETQPILEGYLIRRCEENSILP